MPDATAPVACPEWTEYRKKNGLDPLGAWCGQGFTPRTRGGLPQRFCSSRHRRLFHSTARKFAEGAITLGFLTADDLRRGPAYVFGRARSEAG